MNIEKQYIQQLNDSARSDVSSIKLESAKMDEAQRDGNTVNFDTLGGNVQVHVRSDYREDFDLSSVGFNSSSRGDIYFVGPKMDDTYKAEQELKNKIVSFIEQAVSEYDQKVIEYMRSLGYELKG